MDGQLVVVERSSDGACQSLHLAGGVFKKLSLEDALDLCDDCVRVVDFVLVEAKLRHLRQNPGSCLRANAEERTAVHGETK